MHINFQRRSGSATTVKKPLRHLRQRVASLARQGSRHGELVDCRGYNDVSCRRSRTIECQRSDPHGLFAGRRESHRCRCGRCARRRTARAGIRQRRREGRGLGTLLRESAAVGQRPKLLAGAGLALPAVTNWIDGIDDADGIDDWRSRRVTVVLNVTPQ
jgi:hypothetical protein